MARTVLITGATGFLGRNLLDRLLQVSPDDTYLLLVRSHAAERRIRRRYPLMEDDQLRIVYGDLRDDRLGLSSSDRRRLCRTVDEIWHVAGSTSFHRSDAALLRETNVNGTRYLIDLAQQCRHGPPSARSGWLHESLSENVRAASASSAKRRQVRADKEVYIREHLYTSQQEEQ